MSEDVLDGIHVRGAREHNLKNINISIPRNKITVITGLSGSGKSSLAFDTIYAEGQRRYVESLSAYARNFLEQLKKPDVDSITGLSPAIAIEQKTTSSSPRSTVGTVTEIYDYLRLLFAKAGVPECPTHHIPLSSQMPSQILESVLKVPAGTKLNILSPVIRTKKGEFMAEFQKWLKKGFVRARIDGKMIELERATKLAKTKTHDIELVVDRIIMKDGIRNRALEAINLALQMSDGYVTIENVSTGGEKTYSVHRVCPKCGFSFPDIEPRLFSFNNPKGACETCNGIGAVGLVWAEDYEFVEGSVTGEKVRASSDDDEVEEELDEFALKVCPDCEGYRLRPEALNVKINGRHIGEYAKVTIKSLRPLLNDVDWSQFETLITDKILKQLHSRTQYLIDLGVGYLSLDRPSRTLSGGESQRIRLASQLGSSLVGVLYVLDEPSIGLHPRDHHQLLETLKSLRDLGNTIVLVEHDEETIRLADHVIDIGPRAGKLGGSILAIGTPEEISKDSNSITGQYLSGHKNVIHHFGRKVRKPEKFIRIEGAHGNNLKDVSVSFPLGLLACISGVSGSGKSTLVIDTLYKYLSNHFYDSGWITAPFKKIVGVEHLESVVNINQRPIGRTPRSNPATYVGLFSQIRDLFSQLPESRLRGYKPGRFSFNVKGGRCEACQGGGNIRVEMHFMADVYVQCDVCQGKRYNRETLAIKYRDKSIADILDMSVLEANEFFEHHKIIHRKVETLLQVGLDYISLGQSSTTLSGGEAQRVKLSKELSKRGSGKTLYILDEPTTGLHFEDVKKLIELLHRLVDQGNSVLVIEHNLDVIQSSDYVIDLGPDGGDQGGEIVAIGTPTDIMKKNKSATGEFLKRLIQERKENLI